MTKVLIFPIFATRENRKSVLQEIQKSEDIKTIQAEVNNFAIYRQVTMKEKVG